MLSLQNLSFCHPDGALLFANIHLTLAPGTRAALVGPNGTGKSTLLRVIAGELAPTEGRVVAAAPPYYVPQHYGQYDGLTVGAALRVAGKLEALRAILAGSVREADFEALADDWTIEERTGAALSQWGLSGIGPDTPMAALSGGQKTRVFLAGIAIHAPRIVLLDEPSNHLDDAGRRQLEALVEGNNATMLLVSHDRHLLNRLAPMLELGAGGIVTYGGNYDFYEAQKAVEQEARNRELGHLEKELRKTKQVQREAAERRQKLDARGKKKQEKAGLPTISMNTLRNNAEKSTARLKGVHEEKTGELAGELQELRAALPDPDAMKFGFDASGLHRGKLLFSASGVNHGYGGAPLWAEPLDLEIRSGERIAVEGPNGSGKSTLLRIVLGALVPREGRVQRADAAVVHIDQDYSLLDPAAPVFEQAKRFNTAGLQDHEIGIYLARFLFRREDWERPCAGLSGGERMRLVLCCLSIGQKAPDMIVLDEPTNNLDIRNMEILTAALNDYTGTLLLVSHDRAFRESVWGKRVIALAPAPPGGRG